MRYLPVATLFQHLQETQYVGRNIGIGPFQRIANPRLRGQMDDAVEVAAIEQLIHGLRVRERGPNEFEMAVLLQ